MSYLFENIPIEYKLTSIRKFYFLEYFLIFLQSASKSSNESEVFNLFKIQKDEYKLGESKFKKFWVSSEDRKLNRYKYTFIQVLEELEMYKLVKKDLNKIIITSKGRDLLSLYSPTNPEAFNLEIFKLMEVEMNGFYKMIKDCYSVNNNGLLIFPIYSPIKLGLTKNDFFNSSDILNYVKIYTIQLKQDLTKYLGKTYDLYDAETILKNKLIESELIAFEENSKVNHNNYYKLLKRIRDYWLNYLIKEIYKISLSISYFDIWCYRGKQIGIINITEFYPNFSGRIVYPVSIISLNQNTTDFKRIFTYRTKESLFIHEPSADKFIETYTKNLYESYIDLKHSNKTYFVNIADLRDVVCYKSKISYKLFQDFLEMVYQLNLKDKTKIKISLEADKLPDESKLLYQKRDPVYIENNIRNIIAIDLKN